MDNAFKARVTRSACDECRSKRVRCLRAENTLTPCARCSHIGALCVTGSPGRPGRPRKPRLVDSCCAPRGTSACAAIGECEADEHEPWDRLGGIAGSELAGSKSAVCSPKNPSADGPQPEFWEAPGDQSVFFGHSSIEQSPAPGEHVLTLADHLSNPSQPQGLLRADYDLNAMLHTGRDSSAGLDMDIDPLLADPWEGVLPPSPPPQCFNAASSLIRFREEMDRRIAAVDAYFSDPLKVMQGCKEESAEAENPAALLLTCSREFIDIVQSFTPTARPALTTQDAPPNFTPAMHIQTEAALSTEITLLALSSYLALMRLYDSLFHCIYKCICQMPPDSFKSVKVKSVLRIGGISSAQDMLLKTYATGILDAVNGQVQTLERYMGIPPEYCLSGEAAASHTSSTLGIFSRADRTRLFYAVMAQDDVKARRGNMSYVESIRASIQDSVAFLDE